MVLGFSNLLKCVRAYSIEACIHSNYIIYAGAIKGEINKKIMSHKKIGGNIDPLSQKM